MDAPIEGVPEWVLHHVPVNAKHDTGTEARILELLEKLPTSLPQVSGLLKALDASNAYDHAANLACAAVWSRMNELLAGNTEVRQHLLNFAAKHMVNAARARIFRRLAKDPVRTIRKRAGKLIVEACVPEVALPFDKDSAWDTSGWRHGVAQKETDRTLTRWQDSPPKDVPPIATVGALRELLRIASPRQLGYLLLASDKDGGPYHTFSIPKRSGGSRLICAPKPQLRDVQRKIYDAILKQVETHDAAYGFVPGRSTVANAAVHVGAKVVLKFDLENFFPTIHYYRIMGLFASLGYPVGNAKFATSDSSNQVAPVLARLCSYTEDSRAWGGAGLLPQGSPTSPAISNLICRRLDARLHGLVVGKSGTYTRYADDLTISFKNEIPNVGKLRWWVDQICHQEGFFVNQAKFHVVRSSQRQVVTGIVVNETLHLPRSERRRFRAMLHNCRRHGIASQAKGNPAFSSYLLGFASYIHMVNPEEGSAWLSEAREIVYGPGGVR